MARKEGNASRYGSRLLTFEIFTKEVLIKNYSSPLGLTLLGISLLSDPALVSAILPENHTLYEIIRNVMKPRDQRTISFYIGDFGPESQISIFA